MDEFRDREKGSKEEGAGGRFKPRRHLDVRKADEQRMRNAVAHQYGNISFVRQQYRSEEGCTCRDF